MLVVTWLHTTAIVSGAVLRFEQPPSYNRPEGEPVSEQYRQQKTVSPQPTLLAWLPRLPDSDTLASSPLLPLAVKHFAYNEGKRSSHASES